MSKAPKRVNTEAVHIALSMCCGANGLHQFRRPFLYLGHVYASNGPICARVPAWAAPWVGEVKNSPPCGELPFDPVLYATTSTLFHQLPKPVVSKCDRCEVTNGKRNEDWPPSYHDLLDFDGPPQICRRCGMYSASEESGDVQIGEAWFNVRNCRKLATLGAVMYAPLGENVLKPWRWEIPELHMDGLLAPLNRLPGRGAI